MAEILKEWLTERLQQPIKWEAQEFGRMMKNGHIIAGVLLSYHVITDEKYFLIRPSNAPDDIRSNWKYLSVWLRELGVHLSDSEVASVEEGKGTMLLRLFYQLFLYLDKRDRTNFIKRERQMVSNLVQKFENRFKVDKVDESEESFVDDLSRPLLNEKHYIEWQKKKTEQVKETYDYIRHKYKRMAGRIQESQTPIAYQSPSPKKLTGKEKIEIEKFAKRYPCKFENYTYEELINLDEQSAKRKSVDHDWAKSYIESLNAKINKKADSEVFQKEITNLLSQSLWDNVVAEEETKVDTELAKKVMKLSQFEKQMCTQLIETKQQARNVARNRMKAEKEFAEQREQQFNQFLDNVKEQIHLELVEIDFEKNRQNKLHQKLYAEKIKRKRQHYYEICYEVMLAIVDYATRYAYYKRLLEDDIPDHFIHEWKNLYYKHQPIFDIYEPMEDLLKQHPLEEQPDEEEEEIIRLELDRQEALNNAEFYEYHNYLYAWLLDLLIPNYDPESEERKYEYLGNRILGHLVYTLLEIKYPYPPPRLPADLPEYKSKAIVRGLPDKAITVAMQTLLNHSKVHVVRLENAINYCLRRFKIEMIGCVDVILSYDKFIAAAQEEGEKDVIRTLKTEDEIFSKSSEAYSGISGPLPPNTKQTQTPKTLPEEEIRLSLAAELGKYTYEALSVGDSLTDHLISAMIVEYLKSLEDINGFVIINYPNTYREAAILEETFSGREPPPEENIEDTGDIYLEESIIKHRRKEKDPFKQIRISRVVNDPHKKRIEAPFVSYFNTYIRLKDTEDILQEHVVWDLNEENSELIDRFYAVLGLNYSMYYEVIEKELLALMCKYIIGDLSIPLKSSSNLFGEGVLDFLNFPSSDERKTRSKVIKPEASMTGKSKDKLRRGSKSKGNESNNDLEIVKPPDSSEEVQDDPVTILERVEEENEANSTKTTLTSEDLVILAGEEDWDYGELPITDTIGTALATCWEQIERAYINDLQELFFSKRLQMNCLIPYTRFIKDKMEQIITLPSYKQDLVAEFQNEYNNFEDDWRDVNMTRNEWHCRIKDLQSKLYRICDERKLYAEQQRMALINENWAMEELTTMANTYISCMQAELNRSYLTFQALHDFYYAMIKHLPPNDRLNSKELEKIPRESAEGKKGAEDKVFRYLKHAYLDLQQKNIQIDYSNNPFNMVIENNVKLGQKLIKELNDQYRSLISKDYSEIAKITPPVKKKDENSSEEIENAEEVFKQNALKCIEEWIMGINGEMFRINMRLMALQHKCYRDMKLFNDQIFKAFTDIQDQINAYYMNEIKSVDRLCKYMQLAVENGRKIPETLILIHDTFVIDPNLLQFAPPESVTDYGPREIVDPDIEFKVGQLARLRSQFKLVGPRGIVLQQAFIYLLQDFIFFGKECCEGPLLPEIWKRVDPEKIYKLVYSLFGETAYVDWRDFLIYCLNIRYPTTEELLEQRHKYRCQDLDSTELIGRNEFMETKMWFDSDFDPESGHAQLRLNLIKHFLFELYETSENKTNYSALLLAFCKNVNPIEGFAMALAMAVGKKICFSLAECEEVICNLIKLKKYKDESLACAMKCTEELLDTLINNVIDITCGTTITEIPHTESAEEKGKGKGKKGGKGKQHDISQSARDRSSHKKMVSETKMAHSASNIGSSSPKVMTYICPPCSEDVKEDSRGEEKDVIEEEHNSEAQPDPTLLYAVSQEVIWKVLRACMPWHFDLIPEDRPTPYAGDVAQVMKELETNTDSGDIYVSQFVSHPKVCKILHKVKKFTALSLVEELQKPPFYLFIFRRRGNLQIETCQAQSSIPIYLRDSQNIRTIPDFRTYFTALALKLCSLYIAALVLGATVAPAF